MNFKKGDPLVAKHPTKGWIRGKVRGKQDGSHIHVTWLDEKGWNKVSLSDVRQPESSDSDTSSSSEAPAPRKKASLKPQTKRSKKRSSSSSDSSSDSSSSSSSVPPKPAKKLSKKNASKKSKNPRSPSPALNSDSEPKQLRSLLKQKTPPTATATSIRPKRVKFEVDDEQSGSEASEVDVNELTSTMSGNILKDDSTVMSHDDKKPARGDIIKSLFRLYAVARRRSMTYSEIRRVIKGFTEQDVAMVCKAAPAFFRYCWNPLSSSDRILKERGAAILDSRTSSEHSGFNLLLALIKSPSEDEISAAAAEATRVSKKKKIPKLDPPPEAKKQEEESIHTREVTEVKNHRTALLDACKQVRTVGELASLEESITQLRQQLSAEQKSLQGLKNISKNGKQIRDRRNKYETNIRQLKQQIEDMVVAASEKTRYLESHGSLKAPPKKPTKSTSLPAKVEASARAHQMQQEVEPKLLKLLRVGHQKEGLQTLSCLLLQYAVVHAKDIMLPTQLDLIMEISSTAKLPHSLLPSLRKSLSGIGLGDNGFNLQAHQASDHSSTLSVNCVTTQSGFQTLAWQIIATNPAVDAQLSTLNMTLSRKGPVGIISMKEGGGSLCPEAVRKIAVSISSCLSGTVLAAVDVQGVPDSPNKAVISINVPTEEKLLQRAMKVIKKYFMSIGNKHPIQIQRVRTVKTKADLLQDNISMKSVRVNLDTLAAAVSEMKGVTGGMADATFRHYFEFTKEQIRLLASGEQDFVHIHNYDDSSVVVINASFTQKDIHNIIQDCVDDGTTNTSKHETLVSN
eukprot:TRINITY_DN17395_c0_g1_i1.p1 TRINITY_DN17395_c0_g1~~TRINITY_DN17395_c0_g1_i1.p1  ORF type:complete len:796 (+),score=139.78 TRINITY_DN17395_c0_g1_i1:38-2425(+)